MMSENSLQKNHWHLSWNGIGQWKLKYQYGETHTIHGGDGTESQNIEEVKNIIDLFECYLISMKENQEPH